MKVTISILTYNRSTLLKKLLASLQRLIQEGNLEIVVVDNCSDDDTESIIKHEFPDIIYIKTDRNLGVGARNIGLKQASGEIVVTLDDDIIGLTDSHIEILRTKFLAEPTLGAVNFKVVDHISKNVCNWVHHCKAELFSDKVFLTYEITEGAVAIRKEAIEAAGYYAEHFFLSHEGPDLAFRIMDKGYDVIYSGDISVIHCHSPLGRQSWYKYYYDTRNQFWIAVRNFPVVYAINYLARGLGAMLIHSIRDGFFLYWIKAVIDGLLGIKNELKNRKVLTRNTVRQITKIDAARPNILYLIRKKLLKKGSVRM